MTEMWATSGVFLNEVKFNWKISDFPLMLTPPGTIKDFYTSPYDDTLIGEMASPAFMLGKDKCWLFIKEKKVKDNLTINGVEVNPDDYHVLVIKVHSSRVDHGWITGGSLTIDMETGGVFGVMGDSIRKRIQRSTIFKNQTSKIELQGGADESYFCISRLVTQIEMRVKIYFRSPVTNTIGHEPVLDTGLSQLSADMRALLNRSEDCSDFSIKCGGKTFACHQFILRARSSVLDAMFQNEMRESSGRSMTVVDVGANTMTGFLEYMYTGGINVKVDNMSELIYIADKYDVKGLLEVCFRKLPEISDDMMMDFLFMADKHNFIEFRKAVMLRIIMNKSKYVENQDFMEKLQKAPHLLLEFFKL